MDDNIKDSLSEEDKKEIQLSEENQAKLMQDIKKEYHKAVNKKRYSDKTKEMALTMLDQGFTYREVADTLGIKTLSIIKYWKDNFLQERMGASLTDVIEDYKKRILTKCYNNADTLIDEAMNEKKIEKAGHRDLIVSSGILIDKAQNLEKGNNSEFNVHIAINNVDKQADTISNLDIEIARLKDKLDVVDIEGETIEE